MEVVALGIFIQSLGLYIRIVICQQQKYIMESASNTSYWINFKFNNI